MQITRIEHLRILALVYQRGIEEFPRLAIQIAGWL